MTATCERELVRMLLLLLLVRSRVTLLVRARLVDHSGQDSIRVLCRPMRDEPSSASQPS